MGRLLDSSIEEAVNGADIRSSHVSQEIQRLHFVECRGLGNHCKPSRYGQLKVIIHDLIANMKFGEMKEECLVHPDHGRKTGIIINSENSEFHRQGGVFHRKLLDEDNQQNLYSGGGGASRIQSYS